MPEAGSSSGEAPSSGRGPLAGTLVVEFGNLIAAPYATMLLADLGARVVKVEPTGGDLGRGFGPYLGGESAFFMAVNRGKQSLAVDPKDWLAKRVLDNLVRKADVLVHNLRHGAMERLGLDEQRCRQLNDRLVYTVISAFGASGPYAKRPGIDVIFQGESGMISITGEPKDGPRKTATTIGDYLAGTNAALAVASALAERPRRGHSIEVSLRDGLMAAQSGWNAITFATGAQPERTGTASPFLAPNQVFEAADGYFTLAVVSDRHFQLLCDAIERGDLAEQYPGNEQRMAHLPSLQRKLARVFREEKVDYWLEVLGAAGLPVGRVLTIPEAFADPQARHHGMQVAMEHPSAGKVSLTGSPIRLEGEQALASTVPPRLGEHTRQLLGELGVDQASVEKMIAEGRAVAT